MLADLLKGGSSGHDSPAVWMEDDLFPELCKI